MVNCFYDSYTVLNKVYKDGAFLKQALNGTIIEEKNRALTTKLCYGVLDKDIELSYIISYFTEKSPKAAIKIILKISDTLQACDIVPPGLNGACELYNSEIVPIAVSS